MPGSRWAEIRLRSHPSLVEAVSAALSEAGCAGVVVEDPSAVSSDPLANWVGNEPPPPPSAEATVSGYLPVDDRLEAALADVKRRLHLLQGAGLPVDDELTLRTVDQEDWAEAWKAFYKPLRVGRRTVICPSWEPWEPGPEDVVIRIDPGMAFGSGSHPSTRLCLEWLEETVRPGDQVLDWGTGSGILAIHCALLGAAAVTAIDLDLLATRVAAENAALNGCGDAVTTHTGSIETLPADAAFDLIVANIVADPIIAGAPELRKRLRPAGRAVVAGIIDRREAEVTAALEAAGLLLLGVRVEEDWRALLLTSSTV